MIIVTSKLCRPLYSLNKPYKETNTELLTF